MIRRLLLALFAAAAAGSAFAACEGGIGGTGVRAEGGTGGTGIDGGAGGTGMRADGGIGGTGARAEADLRIFGVITGFGSICVNGVEVHYSDATPVLVDGQPSSASALAIGQTVLVHAADAGNAQAQARSIRVAEAAVGPLTTVDAQAGVFHVGGQAVRLDPATQFGPGLGPDLARTASVGETLRVSGLRTASGAIAATRVERAPAGAATGTAPTAADFAGGRFVVQGYVTARPDDRSVQVGGVAFQVEAEVGRRLPVDALVRVSGRAEAGGKLVAERAERLSSMLNPRPERATGAERRDERSDDRREGRSDDGRDNSGPGSGRDRRPDRIDRGPDRPERPERGGSDRVERPERVDRSGRH